MKKICFISLNEITPWSGSEDLWYNTALVLHNKGYSVSAIVIDWRHKQSAQIANLISLGIKIITVPYFRTLKIRLWALLEPVLGNYEQNIIDKAVKQLKPDLVAHTTLGPRGDDVLSGIMAMNIPYTLEIQLADDFLWHVCSDLAVQCYKNAKAVFFLSEKNRNATEKQLGLRLGNARKHYNPIKTSTTIGSIQDTGLVKFACVGRMGVEHKRQDLILEILASDKWRNRPWELYFYGRGEHLNSIKNLVKMYQLEDKVFFEGYISNIDSVWQQCQVLLLPSTYEGMSLAVMECMQAGRVAIVTNTGGNTEFITDSENGFIAEAATYNLFEDTMERAWQQKSNWPLIGSNAQKHIKTIVPEDAAVYFADQLISCL